MENSVSNSLMGILAFTHQELELMMGKVPDLDIYEDRPQPNFTAARFKTF